MDILDDMGVSKLSAKVFLKSELLLQCHVFWLIWFIQLVSSVQNHYLLVLIRSLSQWV